MVSLLKNIFVKRELTDAELYSAFTQSEKNVKDFEQYIMNIKEGKETIALKEICGIKFSKINEIEYLIEVLEKNNINKGISLTTSRDKKKLNSIYNQLKQINYIRKNFLPNDDRLIHFIYANKYDLFSYLRKHSQNNTNFVNYLYTTYFNKQNYLILFKYFLLKDFENDIKFLLPNENNYTFMQKNEAIINYINLSDIYYNLNKKNDIRNQINNLLLNLIIYFYTNHKEEDIIIKNLNKYIPNNNIEYIEIILSLYGLAIKLDPKITLEEFVKSKLKSNYEKISLADNETFGVVLNNIMEIVKTYYNIYKDLKYLPLEILRNMIMSKAKYDLLIKAIDIIINSNQYNNISVFNFILKYLFDYYCFNKVSILQMNKIIKYLTKYNTSFNSISQQLDNLLEVIEIFENYDIQYISNELIFNDDINDISKDNIYIKAAIEYFSQILEINIQNERFVFSDKNIRDLSIILSYKKGLNYGKLMLYYFEQNKQRRSFILNIIASNKEIQINEPEFKALIDLYLLDPYLIKPEAYEFIENYLDEPNNDLSAEIQIKLENLLEYLKIKAYIKRYKINDSAFINYTLDNYQENIPQILNALIIKVTNIDEIENIKIFLNSPESNDIQDALRLNDDRYYYMLFDFLMKYQRNELAYQLLHLLIESKEDKKEKYFNKCLDYVYNKICEKDKDKFRKFCQKENIEEYIFENNSKYLDLIIEDNDFKNEEKIIFPTEKQSNDVLILYSLIKNEKIKMEKNSSYNDLILSFNEYDKFPQKNKNLKNLIECYYKNKEDNELEDDRVNYNYSLHPKLIELLKSKNYFHLFQDLNITFKAKIQIYNFCINNNVCSLKDIINDFEIIKLKKKAKSDRDIVEKFKLFFNLYQENDETGEVYKELYNIIKENYNEEENKRIVILLIDFNLSNKLNISYNNLRFLNYFFGYKINLNSEKELKLLKLLSLSSNKINILPFCSDFNENFFGNKDFKEILEKYYKNNIIITLKENNKYFEYLKAENIYTNPNIYYQSLELFKILNMSNIFTIKEILSHLNENKNSKVNINLLFILNKIINFLMVNSIISEKIDYGLNNILGIISNLDLSISDIDIILEELFFFQSVSFINNSGHNILLFNESPHIIIRNFVEGKIKLAEKIIKMYYNGKLKNNLLKNNYKIFLIKGEIIKEMGEHDIIEIYNDIKTLNDFKEIIDEIEKYDELKERIYEIYNNN